MRKTWLRLSGRGLLVLGVAVVLLMAWRVSLVVFGIVVGLIGLLVAVLLVARDTWRQTSQQNLIARGVVPDSDRLFSGFDPGLRREFSPLVPAAGSIFPGCHEGARPQWPGSPAERNAPA
jgi:hypothetical protein